MTATDRTISGKIGIGLAVAPLCYILLEVIMTGLGIRGFG